MPEQQRCADRAGEGNEVQDNVVNRGDEGSVDNVRDRDHKPARESHGQEETHHTRQYRRQAPWRVDVTPFAVTQAQIVDDVRKQLRRHARSE